jgi:hypothetical protein
VEFQLGDLEIRARKKVIRTLVIIRENEGISQQAQDEYARLFGHHPSSSHIQAMTALFNWSLSDGLGQGDDEALLASSFLFALVALQCLHMDPKKILIWNVRGLSSTPRQDSVRTIVHASRANIVCIQETKNVVNNR